MQTQFKIGDVVTIGAGNMGLTTTGAISEIKPALISKITGEVYIGERVCVHGKSNWNGQYSYAEAEIRGKNFAAFN